MPPPDALEFALQILQKHPAILHLLPCLCIHCRLLAGTKTTTDCSYPAVNTFHKSLVSDFCPSSDNESETQIPAARHSSTNMLVNPSQAPVGPYAWQYGMPIQRWTGTSNDVGNYGQEKYNSWQRPGWQPYPSKNEIYIGNLHPALTEAGLCRCLPQRGLEQVKVTSFPLFIP